MFPPDDSFLLNPVPCLAGGDPGSARQNQPARECDSMPWRSLDWYAMSECRQNVDGRNSYFPSEGAEWVPTTRVVQLSLAEALDKVVSGEMAPHELIRQLPDQIKGVLDEFAKARSGKTLDALPAAQQRAILGALRAMVQKAEAGAGAARPAGRASVAGAEVRRAGSQRVAPSEVRRPVSTGAVAPRVAAAWLRAVAAAAVLVVLAAGTVLLWLWLR